MRSLFLRTRWYLLGVLFIANCFVWYAVASEDRHGILTVTFLDVGQGDAIFIDAPNGNQVLVDGGPDTKVLRSLGAVMPFYDRSIDMLALSHPHKDHVAGLVDVLGRYGVGRAFTSGTDYTTAEFREWKNRLEQKHVPETAARRGMRLDLGGGVFLDVLLPAVDVAHAKPHDGMLVMRLVYGATSVMLTGDMEENLEQVLLSVDGVGLASTVLKAGHHGSHTSSSPAFVSAVNPKTAVISLAAGNSYGHPHKETLETFEKMKIPVLRTDERGSLVMKSDGRGVSFEQ